MKFRQVLIGPLFAVLAVIPAVTVYSPVVTAQKTRSAHPKKPAQFHYVCPMHDNVTSKSRGNCYKCKMKLVRKPLPKKSDQ